MTDLIDPPKPHTCPNCGMELSKAAGGLCPRCLMAEAAQPTNAPGTAPGSEPPSLADVTAAFPQFEILELIGVGGMGTVWRARQPKLNRHVALKLLPASIAERDPAFAERFEREGQLLARLHHPNIVTVHDSGRAGNFFFLLMEFVDGVNLRQAMRASRFTPQQALAIVPKICDALQYAHDEGVLHRDIKPENILLDAKGRVKLVDFGIAKLVAQPEAVPSGADALAASGGSLTLGDATLGTPNYMAPEQIDKPSDVDHRADIYSLGVVFYELLTGELPLGKFALPSEKSAADPRLDGIVRQALEKERERRQQSVGEMRTQVETIAKIPRGIVSAKPVASSRFSRTAIVGAVCLLLLPVGLLFNSIATPHNASLGSNDPWRWIGGSPGVLLVVIGQLAPTILGWIAVTQIRRSAGKLHGMWLAVFNGLFFPLLALDAAIWWIWVVVIKITLSGSVLDTERYLQSWSPSLAPHLINEWAAAATLVTALIIGSLIIRRVWRTVNKPVTGVSMENPLQAGNADISPLRPVVAAIPLNKRRWEVVIWGFILAVACVDMGIHTTPVEYGLAIGIWGVLLFLISMPLALLAGDDRDKIKLAAQIVLVDGVVVALAGIWCVWHTPMLPVEWSTGITLALLGGSAFCLRSLAKWARVETSMPDFLGWIAFFCALMSGIIPTIFYWLKPWAAPRLRPEGQEFMLWLALVAAILAIVPGFTARRSWQGKTAMVLGGINLTIWLLFFVAGHFPTSDNPLAHAQLAKHPPSFGPVIERVLTIGSPNQSFFNFEHGFVGSPSDFDPTDQGSKDKLWKWNTGHQVDLFARQIDGKPTLIMSEMVQTPLNEEDFDNLTPALLARLPALESGIASGFRAQEQNEVNRGKLRGNSTWAFQTRFEQVGLLQVVGVTSDPPGVKIRYKLLQEPVHTGPPFVARLQQGTVELLALAPHPSADALPWYPDGSPSKEPFPSEGGSSSSAGDIIKEIAFRVRSRGGTPSDPVLRIDKESGVRGMGGSWNWDKNQTVLTYVQAIACPPAARTMNLKVGVAEGDWQTVFPLNKPTATSSMTSRETSDAEGMWKAYTESTEGKDGDVALAFHYSVNDDFETRMVCVKTDGTVSLLRGHGSQVSGGLVNSITTMSAAEYAQIKEFQFQKRRYQWVEFHNVSLEPGYMTSVETVNAPGSEANQVESAAFPDPVGEQAAIEAKLRPAIARELRRNWDVVGASHVNFDSLSVTVAPDLHHATIKLVKPYPEKTLRNGSVNWGPLRGGLQAHYQGGGKWEIIGDEQLSSYRFTVDTLAAPEATQPLPAVSFGKATDVDLLAGEPKTRPAVSAAMENRSFGPVVERVVKEAADLDTGKLGSLPESVTDKPNIVETVLDAVAWMEREGMDVFTDTRTHFFGVGMRAIAQEKGQWDSLTAPQVLDILDASITKVSTYVPLEPLDGSATYVIQTREGGKGLLQILGSDEGGVQIRYKLVQNAASPLPHSPAMGTELTELMIAELFAGLEHHIGETILRYPALKPLVVSTPVKEGEWRINYFHRCRYQDKRGWEDDGDDAVGIIFQVAKSEILVPADTQSPNRTWKNLGLIGWDYRHYGKNASKELTGKLDKFLDACLDEIDKLDLRAAAPSPSDSAASTQASPLTRSPGANAVAGQPEGLPDPVLVALKTRLEEELGKLEPKPTFEIPAGHDGKDIVVRFKTRNYLVHPSTAKKGDISEITEQNEGPAEDGFLLRVSVQSVGEINQLMTPQTIREPYWLSDADVYPVANTQRQMYFWLSYNKKTDAALVERIKQTARQLDLVKAAGDIHPADRDKQGGKERSMDESGGAH